MLSLLTHDGYLNGGGRITLRSAALSPGYILMLLPAAPSGCVRFKQAFHWMSSAAVGVAGLPGAQQAVLRPGHSHLPAFHHPSCMEFLLGKRDRHRINGHSVSFMADWHFESGSPSSLSDALANTPHWHPLMNTNYR